MLTRLRSKYRPEKVSSLNVYSRFVPLPSSVLPSRYLSTRLEALRQTLASEENELEDFVTSENAEESVLSTTSSTYAFKDLHLNENNETNTVANDTTKNGDDEKKKKKKKKWRLPKPSWLKALAPQGPDYERLKADVRKGSLATVCEEARCPNIGECWGGNNGALETGTSNTGSSAESTPHTPTATIMIMGDTCTRGCRFCAVKTSRAPPPLDPLEPQKVAEAIAGWGVSYIVLTSVDRDDVPDHGATHFTNVVKTLKEKLPNLLVECLTPDFAGETSRVQQVALSGLDVFAHNIETVERLTPRVRDRRAGYRQTLKVLEDAKRAMSVVDGSSPVVDGSSPNNGVHMIHDGATAFETSERNLPRLTKTSVMLGLGETDAEVRQTMEDALNAGVEIITFGQYLQPTKRHMKVHEFVHPDKFDFWKAEGEKMGFRYVASGPLVRSSYRAGEFFIQSLLEQERAKYFAKLEANS